MMLWSWETGQPRLWSLRSKSCDNNSHGLLEYHSVGGVTSATRLIGGNSVASRPEAHGCLSIAEVYGTVATANW